MKTNYSNAQLYMKIASNPSVGTAIAFFTVWATVIVAILVGWVANVVQTIHMLVSLDRITDITGYGVLQIIGIFTGPVGSVLGWIGMF